VPLLREGEPIGVIALTRQRVEPFTERQIELVRSFADQAVIAMENARLLTETREALEQQTATAEVLQVINSSPGDLVPVFNAMLEKAMRLCEADFGIMFTVADDSARVVAARDVPAQLSDFLAQHPPEIGPDTFFGRAVLGRAVLHTPDMRKEAAYKSGQPLTLTAVDHAGVRALLMAPLLKDEGVSGVFAIFRREPRPFSEKQIALLQNFAAQAVIAMENARLITETREALEQQTATAEVLQVINSSPGDLTPVFETMLERARRLCEPAIGVMLTWDRERFHRVAWRGALPEVIEAQREPVIGPPGSPGYRIAHGEAVVSIADLAEDEATRHAPAIQTLVRSGVHSYVTVALRKEERLLGAIAIYRLEVRPFTAKELALLQNFAAQAVIAMENARLLTETREALDQQTATAEVLQVINSSPGDLAPVFEAMLERALHLCEATFGGLLTWDGKRFRRVVWQGSPPELVEAMREPQAPTPGSMAERFVRGETVISIADLVEGEAYRRGARNVRALVEIGGARSYLAVALRKDEALLGVFGIYRTEVRPFSDKQVALLQNFAAQAVIAMENARLLTETREALEQQTATAEVLQVINSSPGDLTPIFDAMLEKATTLCDAAFGIMLTWDGQCFHRVAFRGASPELIAALRQPNRPVPGSIAEQIVNGVAMISAADIREELAYRSPGAPMGALVDIGGARSYVVIALRKEEALLGVFSIYRQEVRPFSEKQIALLQNFAAQAVIAMENARLLTETREALEQQTATAEVLQVINSSPGDLAPVFDAVLEKALTLCDASFGSVSIGERFERAVSRGLPAEYLAAVPSVAGPFSPGSLWDRIIGGESVISIPDLAEPEAIRLATRFEPLVRLAGARSFIAVALRKDEQLLGFIAIFRREVRPFSDKQIALLQNFAAQAVIAEENARLLGELRDRTGDLEEALGYQTATSDVLKVISRSAFDLRPVLTTLVETAARLCEADRGLITTQDGEVYRVVATFAVTPEFDAYLRSLTIVPDRGTMTGRIVLERQIIHIDDIARDPEYAVPVSDFTQGAHTVLGVPLMREGQPIGAIVLALHRVEPFTPRQIELVSTFSDQAVIAIENARLLTETREALEQQTATAEVLQVINSSPGDLRPVFDAILDKALRLCEAAYGVLNVFEGDIRRTVSARGEARIVGWLMSSLPRRPGPGTTMDRIANGEHIVQIADVTDDAAYRDGDPTRRALVEIGGCRTMLSIALRKDERLLGAITVYRQQVRPFTDKQIALLENFAAQAVIAMENARLLGELRQRTDEVAELNRGLEARVAEQVEELGRVGRLKRFLAPQLAELIVSQGDEKILESHRREIVVVFCDLRGYTAFTETAEPEEVLDFLREYHGALGPLVSQFEGTLDQFSGDGIMVFFNDPVPIPDAAERAVKMAIAMREAAGTLTAAWRRRGRVLGFGAGIAQGYATLGQIGFADRSGYTAIGTVCNLAARLCAEAKDGQILVGQRVAVAVEETIPLEELAELALKGLTQPVVAFNVPASAAGAAAAPSAGTA
jgi:GAF domain-containing protein